MSSGPAIRIADAADAARLSTLAAVTFPLACPPHATPDDIAAFIADVLSVTRFTEYLSDPTRTLLVAENGDFTGYAMLVSGEPADAEVASAARRRPTVEISKMYVHPAAHGTGVANALMQAALDLARASDANAAWLGVNQLNLRAQAFYRKFGFEVVGTKTFWVGRQRHDDFVMETAI